MSIKILFKIQVLTLALSALVSCSTLNKNECLNADWSTIGYQDGFQGKLRSRIAKHRKACAEYGVKPILDQYLVGYEEGLVEYCQPARGYRRGLLGYNNKQLCNGAPHKPYTDAYRYGYDIYKLEQQIKENKKSISYIIELNHKLEEKRLRAERKLIDEKLNKKQRKRLVNVIRITDSKKTHNSNAIRYHENIIDEIFREVDYLRSHSNY